MYTCPKCGGTFENEQFLVGVQELAASCPQCKKGAKGSRSVAPPDPLDETTALLREKLAGSARDCLGELVVWIGQGTNPGQTLNESLVAEGHPRGIPEALGGACNAIVTEFFKTMLTKSSLIDFHAEMRSIPERYRKLQERYHHTKSDFDLAARKAMRNGPLAEKWQVLVNTPPPGATPALQAFWQEQLDRTADSAHENAQRVQALKTRIYMTESLDQANIEATVVGKRGPVDSTKALALTKSSGAYLIALQGKAGHAVGFWIQKAVFSPNLYVFIDPNTGVFAFHDRTGFEFFIKIYWKAYLAEYPDAVLLAYAVKKK